MSQKTHYASVMKANCLMLSKEITYVYFKNYTSKRKMAKHITP